MRSQRRTVPRPPLQSVTQPRAPTGREPLMEAPPLSRPPEEEEEPIQSPPQQQRKRVHVTSIPPRTSVRTVPQIPVQPVARSYRLPQVEPQIFAQERRLEQESIVTTPPTAQPRRVRYASVAEAMEEDEPRPIATEPIMRRVERRPMPKPPALREPSYDEARDLCTRMYTKSTQKDLQRIAQSLDLSTEGTKMDLCQRIADFAQQRTGTAPFSAAELKEDTSVDVLYARDDFLYQRLLAAREEIDTLSARVDSLADTVEIIQQAQQRIKFLETVVQNIVNDLVAKNLQGDWFAEIQATL